MTANVPLRSRIFVAWIAILVTVIALGVLMYLRQLEGGLGITGLSRDISWGLYVAQFTFLVGVAASAVIVVLPYALHGVKEFARLALLGEMLAIASVTMCLLFIFVDMGQPGRILNVILYPSPRSPMFWDMIVLSGYLVLNGVIAKVSLDAERNGQPAPAWVRPLVLLSIPWAISIHTVTAFLYSGLAARPFWMTALLAPRFLASAFASGPALLILVLLVLRRLTRFDAGKAAIGKLATIATYALATSIFFLLVELFTALYGNIPEHVAHFRYLFLGLAGGRTLVPWSWAAEILAVLALLLLLLPSTRRRESTLVVACVSIFASIWIEKGLGMVVTGFTPSPLGKVARYVPTAPELLIALGIYAVGLLVLTLLYRVALSVRGELA
jgi:molybdopterin-containing oxidoreductase family membrane subunit